MLCSGWKVLVVFYKVFFFQAESRITNLVRSRGVGDVYKGKVSSGPTWERGVV